MSTSLIQLKASNQSRLAEEKRSIDRQRNIMILLLKHCVDQGYAETAERLQQEAGVTLSKFEVADNIDLSSIIQEYETFYEMKFGKKPKLVRRKAGDEDMVKGSSSDVRKNAARERRNRRNNFTSSAIPTEARVENSSVMKSIKNTIKTTPKKADNNDNIQDFGGLVGVSTTQVFRKETESRDDECEEDDCEERLLKPVPQFENDPELKSLATMITRDIFQKNPNVRWDDIVELQDAKRLLKEAVVMPTKYPQLFTGLLSPWCGILLFGPPGTGKTMLAKAVATECRTTFFNISASSIVSKYRGDSEKLVRMLFDLARYHAPSTIFLDEIDSIMGQRGSEGGSQEHEASRRMKTELLIQMDGLAKSKDLVFVLAASNLPWELDIAMLRRLEKRVLVPLPGAQARRVMIQKSLQPYTDTEFDLDQAVTATQGYSGADIKLVVKEAAMGPVRRFITKAEGLEQDIPQQVDDVAWQSQLETVQFHDLERALDKTKRSAFRFSEKYTDWQTEFGSS